jgi:hypothetical protein
VTTHAWPEEIHAAGGTPPPFPPHPGRARFLEALRVDRVRRNTALAAIVLAGLAGMTVASAAGVVAGALVFFVFPHPAVACLAVAAIHLPAADDSLWHLLLGMVEFGLLSWSGVRWVRAGLVRRPRATYLRLPLAIVARIDRMRDFKLRIDVIE